MASTAVHQVTFSRRAVALLMVAFLAAIALAVALPLALRGSHTVVVRTGIPSSSSSQPVDQLRASHGG